MEVIFMAEEPTFAIPTGTIVFYPGSDEVLRSKNESNTITVYTDTSGIGSEVSSQLSTANPVVSGSLTGSDLTLVTLEGPNVTITLTKASVGLGNVDNTTDDLKPISTATQAALDGKVDPLDIANFETSAQLNIRDTANRNRANHSGTQLASTISNFSTAVRAVTLAGINAVISTANVVSVSASDTILSALGKLQARTALLFYGEFARNETGLINNTTTEADFLVLNANVPVAGDYRVDWAYNWSGNDAAQDNIVRLYIGGTVEWTQIQEPKDTAGTGVLLPNTTGGNSSSGTNQRHLVSTFDILTLPVGANEIKITLDSSTAGDFNATYKGVISIRKWGLS